MTQYTFTACMETRYKTFTKKAEVLCNRCGNPIQVGSIVESVSCNCKTKYYHKPCWAELLI